MSNSPQQDREDRAVDALVAAALRQAEFNEPSDEEIQKFLANVPPVSPEGKAALDALGPDIVQRITQASSRQSPSARATQVEEELSPLYLAMNRKNASGEMDARTKEELEKKRKEALERIKNRKKQGGK
ncbi:MAG: hypothetical protein L0Z50_02525 [Verrucomicrobiales bacterium]|nr:hypothetical protein [Verrucomicrobiales bacterium]